MTLIQHKAERNRTITFLPDWRERRNWRRSAVAIRVVQVLAGIAVFLVPQHHHAIADVVVVLGLITAVASPARNGPGLVMIGSLMSWVLSDDAYGHPPVDRVLPFALALFVLWSATALAATSPVECVVRPELIRHWLRESALGLVIAAVLIAVVYGIDAMTSGTTTPVLEFLGVLGVLVVVSVGAVLFTRRLGSDPDR